ncbi:hypothetical protein BXU08_14175 [Sphingomonas sp. LM7]|nr:hypothetical protein BXU08_14175 [Sphingomonas sp. LM7]
MSMHPKYLTLGAAVFHAKDGSWQARLEIIGAARFRRNLLAARLRIIRNGKDEFLSLGDLGLDTTVPFQLTIADGKASAVLGKKKAEAAVPIAPSTARVACSTGDVLFSGLRFTS